MTVITIDLDEATNEELMTAADQIMGELDRRGRIEQAEARIDEIVQGVLEAKGVAPGDPWVQPLGVHDAYPMGWQAADEGKLWESTVSGNVWKPGVSGWREVVEDGDYPDFVQPTGAHDAYNKDDVVRFEGELFKSNMDGNVWSPADYPAGWELFTP